MAQLNIKIGASIDRNLGVAYRPFVDAAKKAAQTVDAEMKKSARSIQRDQERAEKQKQFALAQTAKEAARLAKQAAADAAKGKQNELREFERTEKEKSRVAAKEEKTRLRDATNNAKAEAREKSKADREAAREKSKQTKATLKEEKDAAKEAAKEQIRQARQSVQIEKAYHKEIAKQRKAVTEKEDAQASYLKKGASAAGRTLLGIGGAAVRKTVDITSGIARANGANFDLGSMMGQNADLETMAQQISNSGYMADDKTGRNNKRVSTKTIMDEALNLGQETGTDANDVAKGLSSFVGLTGDLKTGRDTMRELLVLSKATGAEFSDMASAAANVSNVLPDSANKGREVYAVMQAIAGQGKLGAVEIKDLAAQMAKMAASAGSFGGDQAESIKMLGVLAQGARGKGGAASASQAVNSVSNFTNLFDKSAREKALKRFGVDTRDDKGGLLKADGIIKQMLLKASDPRFGGLKNMSHNMHEMVADKNARNVTRGYEKIFTNAGGGEDGIVAVEKEFRRVAAATMANAEIQESFARAMKTGQSQAEVFNQQMRKSALAMQTALLPAIVALAPAVTGVVGKLSEYATLFFGKDPVKEKIDASLERGHDALESGDTQWRAGVMSTQTEKDLAESEKELRITSMAADSELATAQKNKRGSFGRGVANVMDYVPSLAWLTGKMGANGVGHAQNDKEDADIQQKGYDAENTHKLYAEVTGANKRLHEAITKGLVVRVSNLDELNAHNDKPDVPGKGRTPSPETKTGRPTKP